LRPWLGASLGLVSLFVAILCAYGSYLQAELGEPVTLWDNQFFKGALLTIGATLAVVLAMAWLRLETTVSATGVLIRMPPLRHRRLVEFADIRSAKARDYRPIAEYGGWGLRRGRSGYAYNVYGQRGVQLELKEGKPVLVGSQQANKLARVINAYLEALE